MTSFAMKYTFPTSYQLFLSPISTALYGQYSLNLGMCDVFVILFGDILYDTSLEDILYKHFDYAEISYLHKFCLFIYMQGGDEGMCQGHQTMSAACKPG